MAVSFGLSPKASFKIFVSLACRSGTSASSARAPSFIIAEQVGDIRNRHTPLQADARERVPETVRRGGFFKRPGDIEGLGVARRIRFRAWAHAGRS